MPHQSGSPPPNAHESQVGAERGLTIACLCLVGVALILRMTGRYALRRKVGLEIADKRHYSGLDDVFNIFAMLTFVGLAVAELIAIERGMGTHVEVVLYYRGPEGLNSYNLAIYVCAIFYNLVLGMVKLSVLSLYFRILRGVQSPILWKLNWVVCAIVTFNTTANVFVAVFSCHPIEAAFNLSIKGTCVNASAFYLGNAITGIITDTMVYGLSIPIVKPLQMGQKRKIVTFLTLLVGAFAVVTSCVRLGFLPALLTYPDTIWAMGVPMDWSMVEPTVGIIVSSIPAITGIRHLFRKPGEYSTTNPSLRSGGHIKVRDIHGNDANLHRASISAGVGWKQQTGNRERDTILQNDDDSEEQLVYGDGKGGRVIAQTTEFQVSYENNK